MVVGRGTSFQFFGIHIFYSMSMDGHVVVSMLDTIAFFLDETFEELPYDVVTTVGEATEALAKIIRLQNYQTFGLFMSTKQLMSRASAASKGEEVTEETRALQEGTLCGILLGRVRSIR